MTYYITGPWNRSRDGWTHVAVPNVELVRGQGDYQGWWLVRCDSQVWAEVRGLEEARRLVEFIARAGAEGKAS